MDGRVHSVLKGLNKVEKDQFNSSHFNSWNTLKVSEPEFCCLLHQVITFFFNPFTPTDRFRSIQNNEWKSPLKLLSVERVNINNFDALVWIFIIFFSIFIYLFIMKSTRWQMCNDTLEGLCNDTVSHTAVIEKCSAFILHLLHKFPHFGLSLCISLNYAPVT